MCPMHGLSNACALGIVPACRWTCACVLGLPPTSSLLLLQPVGICRLCCVTGGICSCVIKDVFPTMLHWIQGAQYDHQLKSVRLCAEVHRTPTIIVALIWHLSLLCPGILCQALLSTPVPLRLKLAIGQP